MTDRELIELSAKVAGYSSEWEFLDAFNGRVQGWYLVLGDGRTIFDPLTDDGDALRLAVKLMEFEPYKSRGWLPCISTHVNETRRAIVRAAAEIGKEMK